MQRTISVVTPCLVIIATLMLTFALLYDPYPAPGWVDAGIYTGYTVNPQLYRESDVGANLYQGSRLGFLALSIFCAKLFGPIGGHLVFVYGLAFACFASLVYLSRQFLGATTFSTVIGVMLASAPMALTAVSYGGADGPVIAYVLSAAALTVAARRARSPFAFSACNFLSGFFLGATVSAHIFAALTVGVLGAICYCIEGSKDRFFKLAAMQFLGFLAALTLFAVAAERVGLDPFYLRYSFPWTYYSLQGIGAKFYKPFSHWLASAALYAPICGFALYTMLAPRSSRHRNTSKYGSGILLGLAMLAPIFLYLFYDFVIGGSLLTSANYFNIVWPVFSIGILLQCRTFLHLPESAGRSRILLAIVALIVAVQFLVPHVRPAFRLAQTRSAELYRSQLTFLHIWFAPGETKNKQFIYLAPESKEGAYRLYSDWFEGKPRYFDYLDSLTALFLWDRNIAARIAGDADYQKFENSNIRKNNPEQIFVLLGRSRTELSFLKSRLGLSSVRVVRADTCYEADNYPWCFYEFRY